MPDLWSAVQPTGEFKNSFENSFGRKTVQVRHLWREVCTGGAFACTCTYTHWRKALPLPNLWNKVSWNSFEINFNRYRRGLKTCTQVNRAQKMRAPKRYVIFFLFEHIVESYPAQRVHDSPVSINHLNCQVNQLIADDLFFQGLSILRAFFNREPESWQLFFP